MKKNAKKWTNVLREVTQHCDGDVRRAILLLAKHVELVTRGIEVMDSNAALPGAP